MDSTEFRKRGREMVDYIANYFETISERRLYPSIEPGYLSDLLPQDPPEKGDNWDNIMKDMEQYIMPGVAHMKNPNYHAYFPIGNNYQSILADMLADSFGNNACTWSSAPAGTELEIITLDWLGKMIGLPKQFLSSSEGSNGGGVIQTSGSDCILVCVLAARSSKIKELKQQNPHEEEGVLLSKLVVYCSQQTHSCVEKAALIAFVKVRILDTDDKFSLRGKTLAKAMEEDKAKGLVPFFVCGTLGTTSSCSFDRLDEIGPICNREDVWFHVDAAYAGSAFICPELRHFMKGIECAQSFNTNPHKWMLVSFDCSTMWLADRFKLTDSFVVDPLYLKHRNEDKAVDYRHWGISLSRRFRSLKLWFIIRNYGIEGIQKHIREHVRLAKKFESLIRTDERFEVLNEVHLGLVCFRLKGPNAWTRKLLYKINDTAKLHMVPANMGGRYVIRFCVCIENAKDSDMVYAWDVISQFATDMKELFILDNVKDGVKVPKCSIKGNLLEEKIEMN